MGAKYEVKLRCASCGHTYKRRIASLNNPNPPCPRCLQAERVRGIDFNSNRAPAVIGANIAVKAIDETAKIVMEDHGLSDLRTDVREGESATPKLPPRQQAMADSFFMGRKSMAGNPLAPMMARAAAVALSGAARAGTPDAVGIVHKAKHMPPTRFIAGDGIRGGRG